MERDGHVRDFMEDLQIRHVLFVIMDISMILVSDSCKPKCGAGYTLQDGICVKWDCRTTPSSTGPGRCENKSNYKYIETEGYRFIE